MPPDARSIDEEGLRLAPVPFDADAVARIVASSRTPEERRGDLDAQRGANRLGVRRFAELIDGLSGLSVLDEVLDYGERRMRAALAELPDGRWEFVDVLDSAGPRPEQQSPTRVAVTLTIAGDEVTFDFAGTDAQRSGNVNAVSAVTVSAVAFAIRTVCDPTIPANGGALRPVRVIAPAGTVVAAQPPVAVGAGNVEVSQRVADVCLGALAQVFPERVGAAGQGTMNNVLVGSSDGGVGGGRGVEGAWVYYETIGGGQGARPWAAGMSGVHTAMTNTLDTPVEAFERALPMRVRRYGLRRGSGGAGWHDGGEGIVRELEALEPVVVSLITERRVSRPWGLAGGEAGAPGENWLVPRGDDALAFRIADKCTVELAPGDVVRIVTPGGGGWGARSSS
jgi:N-methylhydantoinase B/oxoprolinase/acetone carboxylase alpha subunit